MRKKVFIRFFILIIILTNILCAQDIKIDFSLGINSEWRIDRFLPLFVEIYNEGNKVKLILEVIYTQGLRYAGYCESIYRKEVEIPSLSQKRFEFLLPPIDFRYPVRVRVLRDNKIIKEEKIDFSIERITLPLVLIIGREIPKIDFFEKARIVRVYDEKLLPINYKAYDNYDLIIIDRNLFNSFSNPIKNSLIMAKIFTKRVLFNDEINKFSKFIKPTSYTISIPHNTFLYTPDPSTLQGQNFLYPDRWQILIFLSFYFFLIFLWIRFIFQKRHSFISFLFLILFSSLIGFGINQSFTKDAIVYGEKYLIFLDKNTYVAENLIHIPLFSPFKRDITLEYPPNIFLLYNAYYQPQKNKTTLLVDLNNQKANLSLERNRIYFLEGISYHFIPIDIKIKELNDRYILEVSNNSPINIKDCVFKQGNKENYIGNIPPNTYKEFTIWKSGLKEPSLLNELLKKYRITPPIGDEIIIWGRIDEPLNQVKILNIKTPKSIDGIIIIPMEG